MVTGYSDRFSVAPGEAIAFHLGGSPGPVEAALVRLWHGDERSPIGLVEEEVGSALDRTLTVAERPVRRGSFALVELEEAVPVLSGHVFVQPTAPATGRVQGILAQGAGDRGWALTLEPGGELALRAGSAAVRLGDPVRRDVWHSVAFTVDRRSGTLALWRRSLPDGDLTGGRASGGERTAGGGPLLVAAAALLERAPEPRARDTFNGKLERPALFAGSLADEHVAALARGRLPGDLGLQALVDLDFAAGPEGWSIHDRCGAPGRL